MKVVRSVAFSMQGLIIGLGLVAIGQLRWAAVALVLTVLPVWIIEFRRKPRAKREVVWEPIQVPVVTIWAPRRKG